MAVAVRVEEVATEVIYWADEVLRNMAISDIFSHGEAIP